MLPFNFTGVLRRAFPTGYLHLLWRKLLGALMVMLLYHRLIQYRKWYISLARFSYLFQSDNLSSIPFLSIRFGRCGTCYFTWGWAWNWQNIRSSQKVWGWAENSVMFDFEGILLKPSLVTSAVECKDCPSRTSYWRHPQSFLPKNTSSCLRNHGK